MSTAKLTSKGQLTLPKAIRDALRLNPGDKVRFVKLDDGSYAIRPATRSIMELSGMLYDPNRKPVTIAEMNEGIAEAAVERYNRSRH
jgi:AbrB family looped-hinge helix DNA binding protein